MNLKFQETFFFLFFVCVCVLCRKHKELNICLRTPVIIEISVENKILFNKIHLVIEFISPNENFIQSERKKLAQYETSKLFFNFQNDIIFFKVTYLIGGFSEKIILKLPKFSRYSYLFKYLHLCFMSVMLIFFFVSLIRTYT